MRPRLVSGARVLLYLNGRRIGRVTGFEYESLTQTRVIEGLDEIMPSEIAHSRARIHGNIKLYRLAGDGGIEGPGFTAQFADLSRQKYFSIVLRDRLTNHELFHADYCMVDNQKWQVDAKGLLMGSFTFTGISWNNESSAGGSSLSKVGLP